MQHVAAAFHISPTRLPIGPLLGLCMYGNFSMCICIPCHVAQDRQQIHILSDRHTRWHCYLFGAVLRGRVAWRVRAMNERLNLIPIVASNLPEFLARHRAARRDHTSSARGRLVLRVEFGRCWGTHPSGPLHKDELTPLLVRQHGRITLPHDPKLQTQRLNGSKSSSK